MFLARKITRGKWTNTRQLGVGEVSADAVTADLRTRNNTLSFWRCGNGTEGEVNEAVLALAAGGEKVENIDVVWLAYDDLQGDGQRLDTTAGRTPVTGLVERHGFEVVTSVDELRARS